MAQSARGIEFWGPHIEALVKSGGTVTGYAREHGLSTHALGWWRRKLVGVNKNNAKQPLSKPTGSPKPFVAVKVDQPAPAMPGQAVTVQIGADVCLQLSRLPEPQWLAQVSRCVREVT